MSAFTLNAIGDLLHDGPTAGPSNPFNVALAARLARRLFVAMAA